MRASLACAACCLACCMFSELADLEFGLSKSCRNLVSAGMDVQSTSTCRLEELDVTRTLRTEETCQKL